ncbi:nitrous oxide reductase accessory protein NosL [Geothermobacter hydrogeniphilus]|uniref:Nitrous oxide reductase accessory protein NosL n=1 Tax=Geothermobacter hydrogeniphilus TaxID=1969733 RepID=A0A2K2HB66_9BACT|nr:nitrous oxide reductase accessory protein NosL [Geothermobacter hydrogeniphilus]PNU20556.1 nitrous oxide reductase accessory protein NosL [Geothermobacter hydrogeniphilus]
MSRFSLFSAGLLLFFFTGSLPALAGPPPAPGPKVRCPVCGMFVAPYAAWQSSILYSDGHRDYFDGPKDLFRQFFSLDEAGLKSVREVWVTEYYSTQPIPADEVYFIGGSDVLGPMGEDLVPVKGRKAAETFLRDHGGKRILQFDGHQLNPVAAQ